MAGGRNTRPPALPSTVLLRPQGQAAVCFQKTYSAVYGDSTTVPAVAALQSAAGGWRPPTVSSRWMKLVSTSRLPSAPGVVFADRSTQGMALSSGMTLSKTVPTALLPSAACQDGPAKCLMI